MKIVYFIVGLVVGYSIATTVFLSSLDIIALATFKDSLLSDGKNMFGTKYIVSDVHYIIFAKIAASMLIFGGIGLSL